MTGMDAWIGREERAQDRLLAPLARRWLATFDLGDSGRSTMPQGIHWCLGVPETPTGMLGPDGHPLRDGSPGSFLPPVPAPRRMWAGSQCAFIAPITVGAAIGRLSRIDAITHKHGKTGALTFVSVVHELTADGAPALRETQTLVYRDPPPPGSPPVPPLPGAGAFDQTGWDEVRRIVPSMDLLFRYSALTFNTHRIHYDADYVRQQEGYRGPVVHGPLMASLLLQLAAARIGDNALARFGFRGLGPAIAGEELVLALRGQGAEFELGVFAADGRPVMQAEAAARG